MQFNQYTAYSFVSTTEDKNNNDSQKILPILEKFSKIKTLEEAKEYLQEKFQIQNLTHKFALGPTSFINIVETNKKYSVRISYVMDNENQCMIYNYKK